MSLDATLRRQVRILGCLIEKEATNSLRQQSLVRAIQPSDARVMKFQQLLTEKLDLDQPVLAVLSVLMLRGPQTLGEITAAEPRRDRIAELEASLDEVRRELAELRARFEDFARQFS